MLLLLYIAFARLVGPTSLPPWSAFAMLPYYAFFLQWQEDVLLFVWVDVRFDRPKYSSADDLRF